MRKRVLTGVFILLSLVTAVAATRAVRGVPKPFTVEPYKTKGNPNASVFLLVFTDFSCHYCKGAAQVLDKLAASRQDVRIHHKHYPLRSSLAAEASECAADQGKFWEYHDILFAKTSEWIPSKEPAAVFTRYATELGLDEARFRSCLESSEKKTVVEKNAAEGRAFFVSGTPTVILNGKKRLHSLDAKKLAAAIDEEIRRARR